MLTTEEKRELFAIARSAIAAAVLGEPGGDSVRLTPALERPAATFVTLRLHHALRGCIGTLEANQPLHQAVARAAVSAALRDPRFSPLTAEEFATIDLEISVLTPRERVTDPSQIEVGRDGLVVSLGMRSGLLLPQVATEYGWSREEFLEHTCMKAGLPRDAWRDRRCTIERFSAEVFAEVV